MRRRLLQTAATLALTGLCAAYILWKIDVSKTIDVLAHTRATPFLLGLAIVVVANVPLAWRWQLLLRVQGVSDELPWLLRAYFVSHAAGQVLPTAIGGDAMRIYEAARRHPRDRSTLTGSILLERVLGGCATLLLAAVGFALAAGRYDIGAYLWVEAAIAVAAVVLAGVLFSRRARPLLAYLAPPLRPLRLETPLRAAYEGVHAYRRRARVVLAAFAVTVATQAFRVLAIWLMARAAGVDLGPRPFFVMGPILFLVGLIPFTVNGLAVRESFFLSFLGGLGVAPDRAFATGFLYFLLSIGLALPGGLIVVWEGLTGVGLRPRRAATDGA